MRCPACNSSVEYGQDICASCREVVDDYNADLIDKEADEEIIYEYIDVDTLSLEDVHV